MPDITSPHEVDLAEQPSWFVDAIWQPVPATARTGVVHLSGDRPAGCISERWVLDKSAGHPYHQHAAAATATVGGNSTINPAVDPTSRRENLR